ncbi:MAG: DNA helicase RecQ [Chthonomonadaceae bacterium]|nr:DNA helicase RecQ [Chthonomonadaceae bacterium]
MFSSIALSEPLETLRSVFGFPEFRPHQREIVDELLAGRDAFVLMPTGGGKSLCYQIPAMHREGVGIVVSPLISLMKDQVDALRANGVRAEFYNSSLGAEESRRVLRALHARELDLLYVAPERLMSEGFLERLSGEAIALFAIDEAHCVSQWGHDFRPEYVQLGALRKHFPEVPMVALTATADPQTRSDILEQLGLRQAKVFVAGFDRPNIRYLVQEKTKPFNQLVDCLERWKGESAIVYCLSRKRVEEVAQKLRLAGWSAAAYHAGLPSAQRSRVQEDFLRDDVRIVVATVAFGMGIDKPNVRAVVHYDLPKHLEGYYQETGRAGRDGLESEAVLLYGLSDAVVARQLVGQNANAEQRRIESHKLDAMVGFAEALTCRRRVLLGYFGEELGADCGNCDRCLKPVELYDATDDAYRALMAVYEVRQRAGVRLVIDVLRGAETDQVRRLGHHRLPTYGQGADRSTEHWASVIRQLIHHGYLVQDVAKFGVLKLTPKTRPILHKEQGLQLAVPQERIARRRSKRKPTADHAADDPLFQALRAVRKEIADAAGVPPYVVFGDATLKEMAARKPRTLESMLEVSGVGLHKLKKYGDRFLEAIVRNDRTGG